MASFPLKRVRSSIVGQWARNAMNFVATGAHASFGRWAHVFAFGRGLEGTPVVNGYVEFWHGSPEHMESTIVAKPVRRPLSR
jgi:hypothetical protein